jgi:hypothetical protein
VYVYNLDILRQSFEENEATGSFIKYQLTGDCALLQNAAP